MSLFFDPPLFGPLPTPPAFLRPHGASGIEALVSADIAARQRLGFEKYGVTVEGNPLPLREWLNHAYQESLDLPIYLRRAIAEIDAPNATAQTPESPGTKARVEEQLRIALAGHSESELWGEHGLVAATMRCVDALGKIADLVTTDHESKEAFIQRVRGILSLPNASILP